MSWESVGWVLASTRRKEIVALLALAPRTPKALSRMMGTHIAQVSAALSKLSDKGVVVCLNPDAKRGRIYGLTKLGFSISQKVAKMESQPD